MDYDTREIESITFGIYSAEEVLNMAVCKLDNVRKSGPGSIYDPRMGTTDSTQKCETCKENATECPGHFGYIELNEPIVHPLFYKRVTAFLNCFCLKCYRLVLQQDQISICGLTRYKGETRFAKILEKIKKVDICCQYTGEIDENGDPVICGKDLPKIKFTAADSNFSLVYEDGKKNKTSIILTTEEIKKLFDNISNEDVELLGFDPLLCHPKNFIISVLPVLPPCDRPYVRADNKMCDDDLTIQYIEIIKANNNLIDEDDGSKKNEKRDTIRQRALASLRFRILTTFNNGQGKAKHTTNGRPIKGIKERLTGKDGQIRNNMMGKRSLIPDTPVLMYNTGLPKRADEIKIGDIVIGDDGTPRTVIDTVSGTSPLYKVIQSHGDDYGISCEHILTLKYCGHACINWRENLGKNGSWVMKWYERSDRKIHVKRVSVIPPKTKEDALKEVEERRDLLKLDKDKKITWNEKRKTYGTFRLNYTDDGSKKSIEVAVVPGLTKEQALEEMEQFRNTIDVNPIIDIHVKDYLSLSDTDRRLMLGVKLNTPIQWEHKPVSLDPRILGMWLGDGGKCGRKFTSIDIELIEYWKNWATKEGGYISDICDGTNIQFGICKGKTTKHPSLVYMKEYNLINNKHIPEDYIINDVNTRLLVLAGLIDTDGSVENDGTTIAITQCYEHKQIIDGAQRIAISLGFRTSVTNKKTSWTNKDGKQYGDALKLVISGSGIENIPTLLPHKKCYAPSKKDMSCYNIKVVEDGIGKYYGFEVDKNNRFLLGDATITHNCDQTARTVIGPDPTLRMGEIGVPKEIAQILTSPVRVTSFNIDELQTLVDNGEIKSLWKPDSDTVIDLKRFRRGTRLMHGDIIHRAGELIKVIDGRELVQECDQVERNGEFLTKLKVANRKYKVPIGWIVDRPLQNGNYVLLNRQPTLHKSSMLAMRVVIMPHKTLRINLSVTKGFNADFDGDEMNIHVPQSLESQAEMKYLSAAQWNMISPQSSKPNMAIVQDSLVGAYRMTQNLKKLTKGQFFNIAMSLPRAPWLQTKVENENSIKEISTYKVMSSEEILDRIQHIRRVLKEKEKKVQCFNGHGLISLFLPLDFNYEKTNDVNPKEPTVKIWKGVMYEGTIDKAIVGASHSSIHHLLHKEYGPEIASYFIDCIQFTTNKYLLIDGFSVGLGDCLIPQTKNKDGVTKEEEIRDVISKCYIEAEAIKQSTTHPNIREIRINASLNKAKDIGLRIAKEALTEDNNFLSTVLSGSKGDFFNIAQITGLLGQQNLKGQRVPLLLNHGKRSLPHYPFGDLDHEMKYESRGFIASSFLRGLNPRQFYFHAMSGREGICDTAMGTATSGYMQRRIVKLTEDMKIQEDGTVRDTVGKIYQLAYGQLGFDPVSTVKVKNDQEMCDISRMVARLNMNHELKK
jgi:DNA-directed RNA polymerase beta' subunit